MIDIRNMFNFAMFLRGFVHLYQNQQFYVAGEDQGIAIMNRVLHWLAEKLSRSTSTGATKGRGSSHEDSPGEPATASNVQTGTDGLMPDIYGKAAADTQQDDDSEQDDDIQQDEDTQPNLEILEDIPQTSELPDGTDPYNTGGFKILKK